MTRKKLTVALSITLLVLTGSAVAQERVKVRVADMFERAVAARYLEKLPDEAIIYAP